MSSKFNRVLASFDLDVAFAIYVLLCICLISIIALHHVQCFLINYFSYFGCLTVIAHERAMSFSGKQLIKNHYNYHKHKMIKLIKMIKLHK